MIRRTLSIAVVVLSALALGCVSLARAGGSDANVFEVDACWDRGNARRDSIRYVIVTDGRLGPAFARLARSHSRNGLPAAVVTLREIRRRFRGVDDPDRIRRFLRHAYDRWGTRWLLLGGHDDLIPMRRVHVDRGDGVWIDLATDQYYACLDSSWNRDGDEFWGESPDDDVDVDPDLFVGRAPVRTPLEALRFVDHTLAAGRAIDPAKPQDVLLAASVLSFGFDTAVFSEAYANLFAAAPPPAPRIARLYQNSAAWPGSAPENRSSLLDALGAGPDMSVLIGDGNRTAFVAGGETEIVTTADFHGLRSYDGPTAAVFITSSVLEPGPGRSIGEALLLAPRAEVAVVVGSTGPAFLGQSNAFVRHFIESLGQDWPRAGQAMRESARALASLRLVVLGMHLYGDPALTLMPERPATARAVKHAGRVLPDPADLASGDVLLQEHRTPGGSALAPVARPVPSFVVAPELRLAGHNPARSQAEFTVDVPATPEGVSWSLAMYDLNGRRVRSLIDRGSASGATRIVWDLRDDQGRRVSPGLYFSQLRVGPVARSRMIVVTP